MSMDAMHKSTIIPSLNAIAYIVSDRYIAIKLQVKTLSNWRRSCDLNPNVTVIGLRKDYIDFLVGPS